MKISIPIAFSFFLALCANVATSQVNVLTQHNDQGRTGWNNRETILNTNNVKTGSFGKLFTRSVDDQLYAQLLIMTNVAIPGVGHRNVVYAATVNNSVYAYDADSASVTAPYWSVNLTAAGLRVPKNSDMTGACGGYYHDFSGNIGIVGTPVIDSTTNTIYLVARSCASNGTGFVQYLHALDITTGAEKPNSPKLITAQTAGTGAGSVGGVLTFNPQKENQRSGLLLLNGKVYLTYASHCDWGPYHGWILGYDKTNLSQTTVYNTTTTGYNGGIWMSGSAPSADAAGNIYAAVGNGSVGYNGDQSDPRNRSESALKLTPNGAGLTTSSFFTPNNYLTLENGDLDFGVTQMLLIPNTNRVATACKDGRIYLLDRDNMGGYNATSNQAVQTITLATNAHLRSSLSYYIGAQKEFMYTWSENALLKAFPYNRTTNKFDTTYTSSGVQGPVGNSGAFLSVSSNGSVDSTAVLWAVYAASGDANQSVRPGVLHAFSAADVSKELWSSATITADNVGNYAKFNNPTIANGKVYLSTFSNNFIVYGLTGDVLDTCNSQNIALNKFAVASSVQTTDYPASYAFDGDPATRWSSIQGLDSQFIYVDLGSKYNLCKVVLQWETALGKNFTIDVSDDATTWTPIKTITGNTDFSNYISVQGRGRYVRMNGTARGSIYGYSLYSFEVYGTPYTGDCPVPDSLYSTDIYENSATLHWKGGAANYNIQYKSVSAIDWTNASSDTNLITLNDLACGTDYLFKIQSACSATDTSVFSPTSSFSQLACGSNCNPLPTRWTTQDIGNTMVPGSACYTNDVYTLHGSGNDIGNTTDAFRFAFKTLLGDGEFNARVLTLDSSSVNNKSGIMIRETLAPDSRYAFIALTSGSGAVFQTRNATSGAATSTSVNSPGIVAPYYIKLIKTGSIYSAFISANGSSFTQVGSTVDAGFGNGVPVYAGLALTSNNNAVLSTSTVDNYLFTSGVLPVNLLSFEATLNLSNTVNLKWAASQQTGASYFVVERSAGDYHFTAIDSVNAILDGTRTRSYADYDRSPLNGINFYRLKIVNIDGSFTYSALVMVRISNSKAPLVFPNPAKTVVNIAQGSEPIKTIYIYNTTGKVMTAFRNTGSGNVSQINTSRFSKGIYLVRITTDTNVYTDKLLIQ